MRSAESAVGERPKSVVSRAVDIASREIEEVEAHKRDVPLARRKKTETEFGRCRNAKRFTHVAVVVPRRLPARVAAPASLKLGLKTRVRN